MNSTMMCLVAFLLILLKVCSGDRKRICPLSHIVYWSQICVHSYCLFELIYYRSSFLNYFANGDQTEQQHSRFHSNELGELILAVATMYFRSLEPLWNFRKPCTINGVHFHCWSWRDENVYYQANPLQCPNFYHYWRPNDHHLYRSCDGCNNRTSYRLLRSLCRHSLLCRCYGTSFTEPENHDRLLTDFQYWPQPGANYDCLPKTNLPPRTREHDTKSAINTNNVPIPHPAAVTPRAFKPIVRRDESTNNTQVYAIGADGATFISPTVTAILSPWNLHTFDLEI